MIPSKGPQQRGWRSHLKSNPVWLIAPTGHPASAEVRMSVERHHSRDQTM